MAGPRKPGQFILCLFLIVVYGIIYPPRISAAVQVSGEIININYKYKIAFTDLTNEYLNVGDIVGVYENGHIRLYMRVAETSSAISKLVLVQDGRYKSNLNFSSIGVGNIVVKVSDANRKITTATTKNFDEAVITKPNRDLKLENKTLGQENPSTIPLNIQFQQLSKNYTALSDSLKELIQDKKSLQDENIALKRKLARYTEKIKILEANASKCNQNVIRLEEKLEAQSITNKSKVEKLKKVLLNLKKKIKHLEKVLSGD